MPTGSISSSDSSESSSVFGEVEGEVLPAATIAEEEAETEAEAIIGAEAEAEVEAETGAEMKPDAEPKADDGPHSAREEKHLLYNKYIGGIIEDYLRFLTHAGETKFLISTWESLRKLCHFGVRMGLMLILRLKILKVIPHPMRLCKNVLASKVFFQD